MDWFKRTFSIAENTGYNGKLLKGFCEFFCFGLGDYGWAYYFPGSKLLVRAQKLAGLERYRVIVVNVLIPLVLGRVGRSFWKKP